MFFRNRIEDEEGYVLFVRKNALQVLVPKYGLEGVLYLKETTSSNKKQQVEFVYNDDVGIDFYFILFYLQFYIL